MKYALHLRDDEGELGEKISELLPTKEEVEIFLVESMRAKELDLKPGGYSIETYDDKGNLLELVPEKEAQKASDQATAFVEKYPDVQNAVGTMIASRHLYAVGVNELERILENIGRKGEEIHPLTIEVLIQTVAAQAAEPFSEVDLFAGLTETALPWLQKTVVEHVKQDEIDAFVEQNQREADRRKVKIDIGVTLNPGVPTEINREKPVVFVGYRPALKIILDYVINSILTQRVDEYPGVFTVIRLADEMQPKDAHERMVRVPKMAWANCTANNKGVAVMMGRYVIDELKHNPDVLMCDDLANAHEGVAGSQTTTRAAEAMRKFRQWTKKAGCALIGGIVLPTEEAPALIGTQWDRLKTHSVLRPVTLLRKADDLEEGKCRILVGLNAFKLDVDAKMLHGKLILPD